MATYPKAADLPSPPARENAECVRRGLDPDVFFPEESPIEAKRRNGEGTKTLERYAIVRPICEACSERDACLRYAIATGSWDGMFGGLTPLERWKLAHPDATPSSMFRRAAELPDAVLDELAETFDVEVLRPDPARVLTDHDRARSRAADYAFGDDPTLARAEGPRWFE